MANWVTLANGVHIDLDDPTNPITGSGKFSDLGKGGNAREKASNEYKMQRQAYKNTTFKREQLQKMSIGKLADIKGAKSNNKDYDSLDDTFGKTSKEDLIKDILKMQKK